MEKIIYPIAFVKPYIPYEIFYSEIYNEIERYNNNLELKINNLQDRYILSTNKRKYDYENKIINTKKGEILIERYFDANHILIRFIDSGFRTITKMYNIESGKILNPYFKSIYNTGYLGIGPYSTVNENGIQNKMYKTFNHMIERCYSERYQNLHPTYIGCTVDPEWHNFQHFAAWYKYIEYNYIIADNFQLDKDLLINGNRIYSKYTCCLIPAEINSILSYNNKTELPSGISRTRDGKFEVCIQKYSNKFYLGRYDDIDMAYRIYCIEKEKYIHELADNYNAILEPNVYTALKNYKICKI